MTTRIREGISAGVNEKMNAVDASVVAEDGMLFRRCECGIAHPVGHLHRSLWAKNDEQRHYAEGIPSPMTRKAVCDGCCREWPGALVAEVA